MGIIKRGILGGFSKKVANVVGSSWKGIATMRSLPLSVANPNTTAQQEVRTRFKALALLASSMLTSIVKPLWDRFAQQMSGYNDFIKSNTSAFDLEGNFVPANLIISKGKLGATAISGIGMDGEDILTLTWVSTPGGSYQASSDLAYVAVVDSTGELLGTNSGVTARSSATTAVQLNRDLVDGEIVAVYLAFLRVDGTIAGNSSYSSYTYSV